jgi:hypothetical protein
MPLLRLPQRALSILRVHRCYFSFAPLLGAKYFFALTQQRKGEQILFFSVALCVNPVIPVVIEATNSSIQFN